MAETEQRIRELTSIVRSQLDLLNLTLFVATQGPAEYKGDLLVCSLGEAKMKTSQHIAMYAGQSTNTVLKCSDWCGIPVRDLYPVARCAVESFINAAYLLVESDDIAERAVRWVKFRSWKEFNRSVGSGSFSLQIASEPPDGNAPAEFAEFIGNGNSREWAILDIASRIRRIGEIGGYKAGRRLLAAYANIYSVSSEIIHGSPYGVNYFAQAHKKGPSTQEYREGTRIHVDDILTDLCHGLAGYLSAFFFSQRMAVPYIAEQELFNRCLALHSIELQEIEALG